MNGFSNPDGETKPSGFFSLLHRGDAEKEKIRENLNLLF
jgi:hypothetical protein